MVACPTVMTAMQFIVENVQRDLLHAPEAASRGVSKPFQAGGLEWCGHDFISGMQGPVLFQRAVNLNESALRSICIPSRLFMCPVTSRGQVCNAGAWMLIQTKKASELSWL
jgi:hypothetical protein